MNEGLMGLEQHEGEQFITEFSHELTLESTKTRKRILLNYFLTLNV